MLDCARQSYDYVSSLNCPQSSSVASDLTISTRYNITWSCYSTCGTVCYADRATTLGSWTEVHYETITNYPVVLPPSCDIPTESCSSIISTYGIQLQDSMFGECPDRPINSTGLFCHDFHAFDSTDDSKPYTRCSIRAYGDARLFYWPPPPETSSKNMCAEDPDPENNKNRTQDWWSFMTEGDATGNSNLKPMYSVEGMY